jgi:hypothetical protein
VGWFFFEDVADGSVLELIALLLLFLFSCTAGCMRVEDAVRSRLGVGWGVMRDWRIWLCCWMRGLEGRSLGFDYRRCGCRYVDFDWDGGWVGFWMVWWRWAEWY